MYKKEKVWYAKKLPYKKARILVYNISFLCTNVLHQNVCFFMHPFFHTKMFAFLCTHFFTPKCFLFIQQFFHNKIFTFLYINFFTPNIFYAKNSIFLYMNNIFLVEQIFEKSESNVGSDLGHPSRFFGS